jgi:hypothetical protein
MKDRKTGKERLVEDFLGGYCDEELSLQFAEKVMHNALLQSEPVNIALAAPLWKRLSLAASIIAFALGIILSNQVFASDINDYADWGLGDAGLYSYLVEGE